MRPVGPQPTRPRAERSPYWRGGITVEISARAEGSTKGGERTGVDASTSADAAAVGSVVVRTSTGGAAATGAGSTSVVVGLEADPDNSDKARLFM